MPYMLVRHKVKDYSKWKPVFDENATARQSGGSKGGRLLRNSADPNELIILFEWDDLNKARQFAQSDDLKKAMERAGVSDKPDIFFLEEIEKVSV